MTTVAVVASVSTSSGAISVVMSVADAAFIGAVVRGVCALVAPVNTEASKNSRFKLLGEL